MTSKSSKPSYSSILCSINLLSIALSASATDVFTGIRRGEQSLDGPRGGPTGGGIMQGPMFKICVGPDRSALDSALEKCKSQDWCGYDITTGTASDCYYRCDGLTDETSKRDCDKIGEGFTCSDFVSCVGQPKLPPTPTSSEIDNKPLEGPPIPVVVTTPVSSEIDNKPVKLCAKNKKNARRKCNQKKVCGEGVNENCYSKCDGGECSNPNFKCIEMPDCIRVAPTH